MQLLIPKDVKNYLDSLPEKYQGDEGYVLGSLINTYFITVNRGWLTSPEKGTWQTEDNGLSWRRIIAGQMIGIQFADEQHGWMSINPLSGDNNTSFITQDGGKNWQLCG